MHKLNLTNAVIIIVKFIFDLTWILAFTFRLCALLSSLGCFRRWASSLWFLASSMFTSGWLTAKKRHVCFWRTPESLSVNLLSWLENPSYSLFEPSETAASCPFPKPTSMSQSSGDICTHPSMQKCVLKICSLLEQQLKIQWSLKAFSQTV